MSNDPQNENFDDNQFEEYRDQYGEDEGGNEVKPSGNRPFIIRIYQSILSAG